MSKYIIILLFLFAGSICVGQAQTAKWVINPNYISISVYDKEMYKVKTASHVGIIDKNGNTIVPVNADSITAMTEECALVLQYEGDKYRLTGILHNDYKMVPISEEWYVGDFPFFSEGKLPVYNKSSRYGYIGTNGTLLIDFEYSMIHPFSEGWASVSAGKKLLGLIKKGYKPKVFYIDGQGRTMTIQSDIGDIYTGTTFKDGEALVITKDNRYCFINTSGQLIRIDNEIDLMFDEKYALQTETSIAKPKASTTIYYDGPTTFSENNLYGYKKGNKIILPSQFKDATPFYQGYAIASTDEGYGVLRLINDNFSCKALPGSLRTADSGMESVDYVVSVPEDWKNTMLELVCITGEKEQNSSSQPGSPDKKRTFSFILPKGKKELSLSGEGLIVWNNSMDSFNGSSGSLSEDIAISVQPSTVKANAKDNAYITIIISNKTTSAVELSVSVTGNQLKGIKKKVKLSSGQSQKLSTYFMKVKEEEYRSVSISTSMNKTPINKRIKLLPFFVKY